MYFIDLSMRLAGVDALLPSFAAAKVSCMDSPTSTTTTSAWSALREPCLHEL